MVLTTVSSWRYWSSDRSSGEFSHRGGSSAVQSTTGRSDVGRSASTSAKSVTLHTAQLETIEDTLTLTGTVVPENLLQITSPVEGLKILEMRVQAGDRVVAHQVLAVLDDSVLQAQLRQAQASLAAAQADVRRQAAHLSQAQVLQQAAIEEVNRYDTLFSQGAVSQTQLNERQIQATTAGEGVAVGAANVESARANIARQIAEIDRLETLLSQTAITAPTAGTIAEQLTTVGSTATANTPLYSLITDHQMLLALKPSQTQLASMEVGMPVNIKAASSAQNEPSLTIQGRIQTIEPMLDADSRQGTVKVALPMDDAIASGQANRLRPGMFLQAKMTIAQRRSILLPAAAVISQADGKAIAFTISDPSSSNLRVQAQPVTVAAHLATNPEPITTTDSPEQLEILSGLEAGSHVVVGGASYLQAGDRVTVVASTQSDRL
ncbi:MAG: efflux RND transporter periplasmic adaptor subunit [Phormidesmis sp. RL_2_1]|nr:efflux RND transporter periplasmic adaptor subunit [Phormidesmis sp. RL_2_1]